MLNYSIEEIGKLYMMLNHTNSDAVEAMAECIGLYGINDSFTFFQWYLATNQCKNLTSDSWDIISELMFKVEHVETVVQDKGIPVDSIRNQLAASVPTQDPSEDCKQSGDV